MTCAKNVGSALVLLTSVVACSSAENSNGSQQIVGGAPSSGGSTGARTTAVLATGGASSSTGGSLLNAGGASMATTAATGGTGGSSTTVGASATGGTNAVGGGATGGSNASGGKSGTGTKAVGGSSAGGNPAGGASADTGGSKATGGTPAAGGVNPGGGSFAGGSNAVGGSSATGGSLAVGGVTSASGGAGGQTSTVVQCDGESAITTYPTLPGATASPLYSITANGVTQFVEKMAKFSPEMTVHYANFAVAKGCTADIVVTVNQSFNTATLSPKSRKITASKNGSTVTFKSGPNYLILQVDSKELLFILIDEPEENPPRPGDDNVTNLADSNVDNTGAKLVTSTIQSAIDAVSGATKNILYIPPGRYKVGELSMKSNMTLYLAAGAILDGSTTTGDYAAAGPAVENTTHGVLHMNNVTNANVLGRGVIDGNGSVIRGTSNDTPPFKIDVMRIDGSSKIVIDGITVRDSVFWNTLAYNSDGVTIRNYKVINRRPTTTTYNQTDGIDFDCSTNGNVYNAFVYSGDDSLSPKREEEGKQDTNNITYEHVVAYSNSAATKIGTKTFGTTIDAVTFKDIDIVKAGRAMVIDANDTAVIKNTKWEDIRIEAADSNLIDLEEDKAPDWRTAPNTSTIKDAYFTNVAASVNKQIYIHGKSANVTINGVHFDNFTINGSKVTSSTGSNWSLNSYVSNITFK